MEPALSPPSSHDLSKKRQELAPETDKAFHAFSKQVFADDGALNAKTKQIIAVAVVHVTQCPHLHPGSHQGCTARGAGPAPRS